jgi:dephospho-CoA kinase
MTRDDLAASQRRNGGRSTSPYVIGLTGPIASGKSTVADLLRQRGAEIIDADRIYRGLLVPGSTLWQRVVERFGSTVVGSNGDINRAALADIVFADPNALADLDHITHPAVIADIRERIARTSSRLVVLEAVKLVQSGLASDVDALWFITADPETRLHRLMSRSGMDEESARVRIAAAPSTVPEGVKVDAIVDNSGDFTSTSSAVDDAWRAVWLASSQENDKRVMPAQKECS